MVRRVTLQACLAPKLGLMTTKGEDNFLEKNVEYLPKYNRGDHRNTESRTSPICVAVYDVVTIRDDSVVPV